jgi:hypothetical protein
LRPPQGLPEEEVGGVELAAGQEELDGVIVIAAAGHLIGAVKSLGGDAPDFGGDGG